MPKSKQQYEEGSSFVSYVENPDNEGKSKSTFYREMLPVVSTIEPALLNGEVVVTEAPHVVRYISYYNDDTQGSGEVNTLYVTNFRLTFQKAVENNSDDQIQRNKLVRDDDIVLNCIDSVYQLSKGKRKKLALSDSSAGPVKMLEIRCKDFSLHTLNFRQCNKEKTIQIVNALALYWSPVKLDLLFAFEFKVESKEESSEAEIPRFTRASDWQMELDRLNAKGFKVLQCNEGFRNCDSLPEVMVVPKELKLPELKKFANHFVDHRWPIWNYSYKNGAALLRMTTLIPKSMDTDIESRINEIIANCHPHSKEPVIFDFTKLQQNEELPNWSDVQQAYEKLQELCMPAKKKELITSEKSWLSLLENSGWLFIVQKCLTQAARALKCIAYNRETVILKESNSRDLSPLISSLTQILLDPYYRTINGFQTLVEKEWVALGHQFTERLGLLQNTKASPLFLLFLDCVWQLTNQFESDFQFSDVYLISLWDTVCLGLFDNFIFDSVRNRTMSAHGLHLYNASNITFMSAWDWDRQFNPEYMALMKNPLYVARTEFEFDSLVKSNISSLFRNENLASQDNSVPTKKISEIQLQERVSDMAEVLKPVLKAPCIKIWSHCYFRWVTPLEIVGGGNPSKYLQQCVLVEEILHLKHKIHSLETRTQFDRSTRPVSELVFGYESIRSTGSSGSGNSGETNQQLSTTWSDKVRLTSSFPYRSQSISADHPQITSEPMMNLFLENSFINDSDNEFDSESVDGLDVDI